MEMKNNSLFFDNDKFTIDIVPRENNSTLYELMSDANSLYILVPFPNNTTDLLKILYPIKRYHTQLEALDRTIVWQFVFLSFIAVFIAVLFSFYVLSPLRKALDLLETFIKDIIHDLNTPLTSILINLKMMDTKNEEVESISKNAKTIAMLHQNLDAYLKERIGQREKFSLKDVIADQVDFFTSIYDYIHWEVDVEHMMIYTDKNAFSRIIYNLLSNACKYNTAEGFIKITCDHSILTISNSSYGIRFPEKIFERFYKEGDRGLGIGLHIVDKLCDELEIKRKVTIEGTTILFHLDLKKVTLN